MRLHFFKTTLLFAFITAAVSLQAAGNDSLYSKRFAKVDSLKIGYNSVASDFIYEYIRNPYSTSEILGRYHHHKPFIDSVFTAHLIPLELGLLTVALSGDDVFYYGEDGASGSWAMPYKMARQNGIKMNTYVDERRDIEKSTLLAAKWLKELMLLYNDWPLAMAAYTTTTLTVNKHIRMGGNKFNYWQIRDSLPEVARKVVPAYIAAVYIYNYGNEHGILPKPYKPIAYDTLTMHKWMSFDALAPALRTSVPALQTLNPIFKKGIIPYSVVPYVIKVPMGCHQFFSALDSVNFEPYNTNPYVEEVPELEDKNLPRPNKDSVNVYTGSDTIYHTVVRGQGLGIIAQKYHVTVDQIRKWNNIKGYTIYPNQKLIIIRKREN